MVAGEGPALAAVVAGAVGDGVRRVEAVHEAIATRSWRGVGPLGWPSKAAHDLVAGVAYASVRGGVVAAGAVAEEVLDRLARANRSGELSESPAGAAALAVLDAFAGDHLAREGSPLAVPMTIRRRAGGPALGDEPPAGEDDASDEVVLFVHGLAGWEGGWWRGAGTDEAGPRSHGDRLREERGLTPLYLRYNTGRPVAENGAQLADLLERLVATWPVPVRRLHLVGHSMGGLVVRSACHAGAERGDRWVRAVRHCVYLGTPHLGAPLARVAVALGSLLVRVPELRPFAGLLERPSGGTRDLRFGLPLAAGVDEAEPADWFGRDLVDLPVLPSARHHAVSAALGGTGPAGSLVDRVLGDLLVLSASAAGEDGRRRVGFDPVDGAVVRPANHLGLLDNPAVATQLAAWLDEPDGP